MLWTRDLRHPRWVMISIYELRDTYTGDRIKLTCRSWYTDEDCARHAVQVLEALNRIYT